MSPGFLWDSAEDARKRGGGDAKEGQGTQVERAVRTETPTRKRLSYLRIGVQCPFIHAWLVVASGVMLSPSIVVPEGPLFEETTHHGGNHAGLLKVVFFFGFHSRFGDGL